ncbi:hypothetical protein MKW98_028059 [Papaver atlanticum]|uniref:MADS-box domain-containing protein n=1 Tax=Papaver atlanticum TaxID=357466 RepID=A0AAD4SXK4_9MAGN|nr:hypothetical protein MKW98_028059 [Papaver atlanticum]
MARKKVKLAYIADASARKATFRKRRKGLLKKVNELSTLCDVSACAIVYGPYEPQPEVWPEKPEALRVLTRFKNLPKMEQFRNAEKQLNRESYARNRIEKINEQWKKHKRENRYIEINWIYNHSLAGECSMPDAYPDLVDFAWFLGEKHKEVQHKLENLNNAPAPVVRTIRANTRAAVFTTGNGSNANTTAIPNNPSTNFINTNVDVDVLEINGGTVTGGDMYVGVVNHHNQGGGVIINGIVGQEMMASAAAMEALQSQQLFMDVNEPPSVLQPGEQMVNYLEGDQNNTQMMMQLGGVPRPSYNSGHEDIVLATNNQTMMSANNSYVQNNTQMMMQLGGVPRPSYNGGLEDIVLASNNQMMMSAANNSIYSYEQYPFNLEQFLDD